MRALLAIALVACAHRSPRPVNVIVEPCEQRAMRPAVQCSSGQLGYDGCRWNCTLEPIEQPPTHLDIDFQGYRAEGQ